MPLIYLYLISKPNFNDDITKLTKHIFQEHQVINLRNSTVFDYFIKIKLYIGIDGEFEGLSQTEALHPTQFIRFYLFDGIIMHYSIQ